jgi:tyrosyl-tRNA synthetase
MGGSDQWGNIVAGIDLVRKLTGQSVYGLTFPLLTKSDGKKFGKTEDGAVWLSADRYSPYEFYQYLYRISDADVIKLMRMLTFMDMEEVRRYEKEMTQEGYVPNTAQKRLASEITQLMHDEEGLQAALKVTEAASPGDSGTLDPVTLQEVAKDMPHVDLSLSDVVGCKFVDVALKIGLLPSKGEGVRLIGQGGAYLNNEKIDDPQLRLGQEHLIGGEFLLFAAGKKKKILIKITK